MPFFIDIVVPVNIIFSDGASCPELVRVGSDINGKEKREEDTNGNEND